MDKELEHAISAGVVVKTQTGYRCEVCDRDVTEIMPHLRGRDHFNNFAWEALRNPAPHSFLLDAIPPVVREAKEKNELELVDKTVFSTRCLVCPRRPLSNGIRTLETHLKGKEHEKAKKTMNLSQPLYPPSSQPSNINTLPQFVSQNPDPQLFQVPRGQLPSHFQPQYPPAAVLQPQYASGSSQPPSLQPQYASGRSQPPSLQPQYASGSSQPPRQQSPASQSLIQHPMSLYNPPSQPRHLPSQTQNPLSSQLVASNLPQDSAILTFQKRPVLQAVAIPQSLPLAYGDSPGPTGLDPELQRAVNTGTVAIGDGLSITCRVCEKNFTGPAPCLEHLRSDKHRKKEQTWMQQQLPNIGQLTLDEQPGKDFDSLKIVGRGDQVDGSWVFPWKVVTHPHTFPPTDNAYRNLSMPRGLVLIFNYSFTDQGENERHGAKRDSFNIKTLFHRMGYLVYLYEDLSKTQTLQALASTQNDPFLSKYDSLIVFIMSHGKDNQVFHTASGQDEGCMKLDDVRYKFTNTECPALSGKPKLFFVNFCRGGNLEPQTAYDSMSPQKPGLKDMITLYACINTFKAPRDPEKGTLFVQAWCEVLAAHAHSEELRDLHHRVCKRVLEMNGATPELQDYFFKKFYFNPAHLQ